MHFLDGLQKEKKQSHVKHEMISKQEYVPFTTLDGTIHQNIMSRGLIQM